MTSTPRPVKPAAISGRLIWLPYRNAGAVHRRAAVAGRYDTEPRLAAYRRGGGWPELARCGHLPFRRWRRSRGNTFNPLAGLDGAATFGAIITDLAHGLSETWDRFSEVEVVLSSGSLASVSELALLNSANAALIGDELVQFQNATLIAERTYRLSRLLRGRQGTEWAMGLHAPGDRFVLLSPALYTTTIANNLIGRELYYKAVSVGNSPSTTGEIPFTYTGKCLKPFAPVHVSASRDGSGNLTIGWRAARAWMRNGATGWIFRWARNRNATRWKSSMA